MNAIWAVHLKGKLMSQVTGDRQGAIYNTEGKAKAAKTRWAKKLGKSDDLEVVRYEPVVRLPEFPVEPL